MPTQMPPHMQNGQGAHTNNHKHTFSFVNKCPCRCPCGVLYWIAIFLVNLPIQLSPYATLPTHAYADCNISGQQPTHKDFPRIHKVIHPEKNMMLNLVRSCHHSQHKFHSLFFLPTYLPLPAPNKTGLISQFQPFLQDIGSQNFFHLLEIAVGEPCQPS